MTRPSKDQIKANPDNVKSWEDYQAECMYLTNGERSFTPILQPIKIGLNSKGELTKKRVKAGKIKKLAKKLKSELPPYLFNTDINPFNPNDIFDHYVKFFEGQDGSQSLVETPLDLKASMPVWTLFLLKPSAWTFSEDIQFSCVNDPIDLTRNFEKIATLDKNKVLLMSNRRRCAPENMKFNLHVTITQGPGGSLKTPIIIDPEQDNDQNGGGFPL